MSKTAELHTPQQQLHVKNDKEGFLADLLDRLWERYREKMEYVRKYETMIVRHGAIFRNDHIAFRTIAAQDPLSGIFEISRIFEALGYNAAECYEFPDKHLSSIYYQNPNPDFPKIFITQLKSWELSYRSRDILHRTMRAHRTHIHDEILYGLWTLPERPGHEKEKLLKTITRFFHELPWDLPQRSEVSELDKETQYGAWVLVNGFDVNHFTALVNSHGVPSLDDIEKTVSEMKAEGIPMKKEIEGEKGSKLRQTSTESVVIDVSVRDGNRTVKIPWTYAYFEIAERPLLKNLLTGKMERFEGFLGGQATHLFEMTKLSQPHNKI